jgi:hypothetical protein
MSGRPVLHPQAIVHEQMMPQLTVRSVADIDSHLAEIEDSAARLRDWLGAYVGTPLELLRRMKFDAAGHHPLEKRPINIIEQVNQTWTYTVALMAARQLLLMHPEAGGFHLAPGAHASLELDIMSEVKGLVGAESFAAVTPRNNGKLAADLTKMGKRGETHRYVFLMSPQYPGTRRWRELEKPGLPVQVWSVSA